MYLCYVWQELKAKNRQTFFTEKKNTHYKAYITDVTRKQVGSKDQRECRDSHCLSSPLEKWKIFPC